MRARPAQNLVELALLLPLFALLIAIAVDFARVYQVAGTVNNAARVGAEYAATQNWQATPSQAATCARVQQELGSLWPASIDSISLQVRTGMTWETLPAGAPLAVEVRARFRPVTPLAASFLPGGAQPLTARMVLRRNCDLSDPDTACWPIGLAFDPNLPVQVSCPHS